MITHRLILVVLTVAFGSLAACGVSTAPDNPQDAANRPVLKTLAPIEALEPAVHLAAQYLIQIQRDDGSFVYRSNMDPDIEVTPSYNLLRHAGTLYSLAAYAENYRSLEAVETVIRGTQFLRKTLAPVAADPEMLAVWSDPELTQRGDSRQAKLGGTGLGLVAMVAAERLRPGTVPESELRAMARFLMYMQRPDGGFYSKYIPENGGRDASWVSLYYPGEAALGLAMLYEHLGDPEHLTASADALAYLGQLRFGQPVVEPDHWALIATEGVLKHYDAIANPPPRVLLVGHAAQVVDSILATRYSYPPDSQFHGAMGPQGRTTPTATRLEGLLAAFAYLPPEYGQLSQIIAEVAEDSVPFLMRTQVQDGPFKGAIPRAIKPMAGKSKEVEDFNERWGEVRIDYVQHALSAFMQYWLLQDADST